MRNGDRLPETGTSVVVVVAVVFAVDTSYAKRYRDMSLFLREGGASQGVVDMKNEAYLLSAVEVSGAEGRMRANGERPVGGECG